MLHISTTITEQKTVSKTVKNWTGETLLLLKHSRSGIKPSKVVQCPWWNQNFKDYRQTFSKGDVAVNPQAHKLREI